MSRTHQHAKGTFLPLRPIIAVWLALTASCIAPRLSTTGDEYAQSAPKVVKVRELPGNRIRLDFEPVASEPFLEPLSQEDVRAALAAIHAAFPLVGERQFRLIRASTKSSSHDWEGQLRDEFVSRYGLPTFPLPESLETSPVFLALKLSPRYMGDGVREAARELFNSPVFLSSVAFSVLVYFSAWLLPEPVFSKAFVAALTLRLSLAVGALELNRFARACVRLYRDAQAAKTVRDVELVAARFGSAMGGSGLRVLIVVASMGVAKGLPRGPTGGFNLPLGAPRFALPQGVFAGRSGVAAVQMAADGAVIVTGATAGLVGSSVGSACSDGATSKDGHRWHHLATNKNDISERSGGPWTPLFERLFARAGMSLDAAENLVYLKGHQGPHPAEYHSEIYQRIEESLGDCRTAATCRGRLVQALKGIADEVCTPGSILHQWLTKG